MFPTLYATNKNGTTKFWRVHVIMEVEIPVVVCEYGQKGGKTIESRRPVDKLKQGHDSLYAMAVALAESKWNHKKDREGYTEQLEDSSSKTAVFPMLAKTFEKGKYLRFPLYIQPKIDGLRCLASWDDAQQKVRLVSRTNVDFGSSCLERVRESLAHVLRHHPELVLDGELFADNVPFEELSGAIRNAQGDIKVYFLVFDVVDTEKGFEERFVHGLHIPNSPFFRKLETFVAKNLEEAMSLHKRFKDQGYEGTIFRNTKGIYRTGFRSWDLQKLKDFQEEEFEIVGFMEGTGGREKGTVIWECATQEGKQFRVRPRGSLEHRKELLKHASDYIGSLLTVVFQEKTREGIPRFPVGKDLRKNY